MLSRKPRHIFEAGEQSEKSGHAVHNEQAQIHSKL